MRKLHLKGSYTVEAALLSSTLLMIMIFVLFWSLMLYNRTVLQVFAIRGAKQIHYVTSNSKDEAVNSCENVITNGVTGKTVATQEIQSGIVVEKKSATVTLSTIQESVSLIPLQKDNSFWEIEMQWEENKAAPADLFRQTRKYFLYWDLISKQLKEKEE